MILWICPARGAHLRVPWKCVLTLFLTQVGAETLKTTPRIHCYVWGRNSSINLISRHVSQRRIGGSATDRWSECLPSCCCNYHRLWDSSYNDEVRLLDIFLDSIVLRNEYYELESIRWVRWSITKFQKRKLRQSTPTLKIFAFNLIWPKRTTVRHWDTSTSNC